MIACEIPNTHNKAYPFVKRNSANLGMYKICLITGGTHKFHRIEFLLFNNPSLNVLAEMIKPAVHVVCQSI